MTDCPNGDIRDLLPDLVNGGLGVAERAEVEAHLRGCEDCRDELDLLRSMRGALRRGPAIDVDGIVAGIAPYRAPVRALPSRSWGAWRIAAAVALLTVGGTSVVVARNGDHTAAPAAGASAAAPRELALSGGTVGELDDSELSALLDDIGSLNAETPVEVDNAATAGPLVPTAPTGTFN